MVQDKAASKAVITKYEAQKGGGRGQGGRGGGRGGARRNNRRSSNRGRNAVRHTAAQDDGDGTPENDGILPEDAAASGSASRASLVGRTSDGVQPPPHGAPAAPAARPYSQFTNNHDLPSDNDDDSFGLMPYGNTIDDAGEYVGHPQVSFKGE